MSDRVILPTAKYLQKLRAEGKYPHSRLTNIITATIFAFASILYFSKEYIKLLEKLFLFDRFQTIQSEDVFLFIIPNIIYLFTYFTSQLLQTKFLLIPIKFKFLKLEQLNLLKVINKIIISVLLTFIGFLIAIYCFVTNTKDILEIMNNNFVFFTNNINFGIIKYLVIAMFIGCLSWLVAKYTFLFENKMTKEELKTEEE